MKSTDSLTSAHHQLHHFFFIFLSYYILIIFLNSYTILLFSSHLMSKTPCLMLPTLCFFSVFTQVAKRHYCYYYKRPIVVNINLDSVASKEPSKLFSNLTQFSDPLLSQFPAILPLNAI